MRMQIPDPNTKTAPRTPRSAGSEAVARQDAQILSLEKTIRFQQELLTKQHDLMHKQIALIPPSGLPQSPVASVETDGSRQSGPLKLVSHPLWASYLSGCLLILTTLVWTVMRTQTRNYFLHSPDTIAATLLLIGSVSMYLAGGYTLLLALIRKKVASEIQRICSFGMGVGAVSVLAAFLRIAWHQDVSIHHRPQDFLTFSVLELVVVGFANIVRITSRDVLLPKLQLSENFTFSENQRLKLKNKELRKKLEACTPKVPGVVT